MSDRAAIAQAMLAQQQPGALGSGIAPYGMRYGGDVPLNQNPLPKGQGWFGPMQTGSGSVATEISSDNMPLLVPTLDAGELNHLLSGGAPTEEIYRKARAFAEQRAAQGLSPFAGPGDLRMPRPR